MRKPEELKIIAEKCKAEYGRTYGFNHFINKLTEEEKKKYSSDEINKIFRK